MTRALITGVTGCVGSNLAVALVEKGMDVVGLCQPGAPTLAIEDLNIKRFTGDICDPDSLAHLFDNVDWVFHVAAIADDWRHPAERIYQVNVQGTRNVLAAARRAGVRKFVLTSSAAALGLPRPGKVFLDESCEFNLRPTDWVYAHSKVLAEQALAEAVRDGLDAVSVLPTAILGPADMNFISGQLIQRAVQGQVFPFPDGGVNYIDVRDVAEAQVQAALRGWTGERYLLGGHNISHLHCLGTISDVLQVPIQYIHTPSFILPVLGAALGAAQSMGLRVPIDRQRIRMSREYMYYDNTKAVTELGLVPRPIDETVEATYRWYHDHGLLNAPSRAMNLRPNPLSTESVHAAN